MQLDRDSSGAAPAAELKAFLKNRRERLQPDAVGLPSRRSTRTRGLRREDMAELLGVSPLWYSLFESGTSRRRFSAAFLRRVQDALRLDADDYDRLVDLAVASDTASPELKLQWYSSRWDSLTDFVSDAAERIAGAPHDRATEMARASMSAVLQELMR